MATKFTFPRHPKIGDRIEIVSISQEKLPINLVGNPESEKSLTLVFPGQIYSANSDGETIVATITEQNVVYGFRCVSTKDSHVWLMEDTALNAKIKNLENKLSVLEAKISAIENSMETE